MRINKILQKELELKEDYYVFYHGQKREFLLFQDLFEALYKIKLKKAFSDFIMLRIPDRNHKKYKNAQNFLEAFD